MDSRFERINHQRKCPTCLHWWFDRMKRGCRLDDNRTTNTTAQLGSEFAAGECEDYEPDVKHIALLASTNNLAERTMLWRHKG